MDESKTQLSAMSQNIEELQELFIRDLERLESELTMISGEHLWKTAPGVVNIRNREKEFTETGISADKLINDINETSDMIVHVLSGLTNEELNESYPLDIPMDYTIHKFLLHLYGHLSYHLGQVNYLRRILSENQS